MFCTSCGTKNIADSNFCKQCGHKLDIPAPAKISEEAYDRALPEDEQVSALLERAYRLRTEGDAATAISLCEEALRIRPGSTSAHSLLAQLYEQVGDREKAIQERERVLALNPGSIADRVKLDELRDGKPTVPHNIVSPRLALSEPGSNFAGLAAVVVVAVLLATGITYALVSHSQSSRTGPPRAFSSNPPGSSGPVGAGALASNNSAGTAAPANNASLQTQGTPQTQTAGAAAPNYGFPPPYFYSSPPVVIRESAPGARQLQAVHVPVIRNTQTSGAGEENGGKQNRVMLTDQGEGGIPPQDEQGNIVIKVPAGDKGTTPDAAPTVRTASASGNVKPGSIKIDVRPAKTGSSGSINSGELNSLLSMASDLFLKRSYNSAISTYQKALPLAGDNSGYVYQQVAVCFESKGDKTSALTNYQHALEEFKRLDGAGRLTARDRDGMRVCQNGIKICSGE